MSPKSLRGRLRRRGHDQRGASAVIIAIMMMVIMAAGAVGFDISKLVYERQQVRSAVDAAAQIGAAKLTSTAMGTSAAASLVTLIKTAAANNYSGGTYGPGLTTSDVTVAFFCVVANTSGSSTAVSPNANQIPSTCNPSPISSPYTAGTKCSATSCAIPCAATTNASAVCNAIQVSATKLVQYVFAPAIKIDHGSVSASTVSCQGTCGGEAQPNPMNVVVMADRTPSMWGTLTSVDSSGKVTGTGNDSNISALRSGIEDMLKIMTPDQQYVSFGALHQSTTVTNTGSADNLTKPVPSGGKIFSETSNVSYTYSNQVTGTAYNSQTKCEKYSYYWYNSACYKTRTTVTTATRLNQFAGTWVPVGFTKTYLNSDRSLNNNTDLYASVHNLAYSNLTTSGSNGSSATYFYNSQLAADGSKYTDNGTGTHLASALKGAARYLLSNVDSNNYISGLDSDGFRASLKIPVKNVIIFETDGQPDEIFDDAANDSATPLSLSNSDDIGSTDDYRACQNFKKVADEVKAAGIMIVTIGFGSVNSATCKNSSDSATARSVLAYAASTKASVTATGTADSTCSTAADIAAENSDSDLYYCAASASDLASVFSAAMGSINGKTKFMAIDGVGD